MRECSLFIKNHPKNYDALVGKVYQRRAEASIVLEKYEAAQADLDFILEHDGTNIWVKFYHACTTAFVGHNKEAETELLGLIKLDPKFAPPYATLAALRLKDVDVPACIDYASKAISLDKTYTIAYTMRAQALLLKGDYSGCVDDISRAIELTPLTGRWDPDHPYLLRGKALSCMGRYQQAINNYQMAKKLNPSSFLASSEIWRCYYEMQRYFLARA